MPGSPNPIPTLPLRWSRQQADEMTRRLALAVNRLLKGKNNAANRSFTCTINVTSTVVVDELVHFNSHVNLTATTAHAATELATLWITYQKGQFTVNHSNSAFADRTFTYEVCGS